MNVSKERIKIIESKREKFTKIVMSEIRKFDTFSSRTLRKSYLLSILFINITSNCNLKCKHCWNILERNRGKNFLQMNFLKQLMSEALSLGLNAIKITGGEPSLHPELLDILVYLNKLKISKSIEINGTSVQKEMVYLLLKGNWEVSVSLHGSDSKEHDSFCGVEGSFHDTIKGIKLLVKNNNPVTVIFTLREGNKDHLKHLFSISEKYNFSIKITPRIVQYGRGCDLADENLSATDIFNLFNTTISSYSKLSFRKYKYRRVFSSLPIALNPIEMLSIPSPSYCKCPAGYRLLSILPDFSTSACQVDLLRNGNLIDTSLKDIWENNLVLKKIRKGRKDLKGICQYCFGRVVCGGGCVVERLEKGVKYDDPHPLCTEFFEKGLFPIYALKKAL